MDLTLLTPKGVQFQETIDYFVVESKTTGDFAVLNDHVPVIAALDDAMIKMHHKNQILYIVVINGHLEFHDNQATVIAQEANVGTDKEKALENLLDVREERIKENQARQKDFLKAENELKKNIKASKAGQY
jgi:F-type H+-transporting ATPase subunit epsilon